MENSLKSKCLTWTEQFILLELWTYYINYQNAYIIFFFIFMFPVQVVWLVWLQVKHLIWENSPLLLRLPQPVFLCMKILSIPAWDQPDPFIPLQQPRLLDQGGHHCSLLGQTARTRDHSGIVQSCHIFFNLNGFFRMLWNARICKDIFRRFCKDICHDSLNTVKTWACF